MYYAQRKGKATKELDKLYEEYHQLFKVYPDFYLELEGCYDMRYEEYVECIERKKEMPHIVYPDENPHEWEY